ncbi:MAG: hypothetical protein QY314_02705 [Candidatus Dojkabacteria bacterium]|nr:MAG: hypothetical protein QY314_02705 [Candidatus Dojkabacteria bacterium]
MFDFQIDFAYYKVMSMVRQIAIAVIATIILIIVGVGSYMISRQVIPDPTTDGTNGQDGNNGSTTGIITVQVIQRLSPKNMINRKDGEDVVIQFDTEERTGAVVYLTPEKSELIQNVVRDWNNAVPVKGQFYPVTSEDSASTAHSLKISNNEGTIKSGEWYYYVILLYQGQRIPYGGVSDPLTGPSAPYVVTLTD